MAAMAPLAVVLDPALDGPQPALEKACHLARLHGQRLEIFVNARDRALEAAVGDDEARLVKARDSVIRAWEKRITTLLEAADAPASSTSLFWERDGTEMLARFVHTVAPSLVVIHAHRASGLRRLLFTPLHWHLIHHAPCEVLCVGDDAWSTQQPVYGAIDLDQGDDSPQASMNRVVMDATRRLCADFHRPPELVNVVEFPDETLVMLAGDALPVTLTNPEALKDFYLSRLVQFCEAHGLPAQSGHLLEGGPAQALADWSDNQGGILVLGTGSHGVLHRLLLGSTAERVLQHAHGDVLVVKPADFESPWATLPELDPGQPDAP